LRLIQLLGELVAGTQIACLDFASKSNHVQINYLDLLSYLS